MKSVYISYIEGYDSNYNLCFQSNGHHEVEHEGDLNPGKFLSEISANTLKDAKSLNPAVATVIFKGIYKL